MITEYKKKPHGQAAEQKKIFHKNSITDSARFVKGLERNKL